MPYTQAYDLLQNPNSNLIDLLHALEEMAMEYGYLLGLRKSGYRKDCESDLIRTFIIIEALKSEIKQKYDRFNN